MRIGEILLQQAVLTEPHLDAALRTQGQYGGRFASVLVDLGYVDADLATRALSKQKKVPAALAKHFDAIDPKAIARLSAKVAEKLLAIPLGFTGEGGASLIVAMADPTDLAKLDELRFALGCTVLPGIALEGRIRRALERHYGVRPQSNRDFVAVAQIHDHELSPVPTRHVYAPVPSPGSQPRAPAIKPGTPDLTLDMPPPSSRPARPPSTPRLANVFGDKAPYAPPPSSAPPSSIAPNSLPPFTRAPTARPRSFAPPLPREEAPEPSRSVAPSAQDAIAAITRSPSLESRVETLLRHLRNDFEAAVVFVPRNDIAFAWKAFSPAIPGPDAPQIAIPLTQPSLLTLPYEARTIFTGAPPPEGSSLHEKLWNGLRISPPRQVLAMPLLVDGQVAALIYAHRPGGQPVPPSKVLELTTVCAAIAPRASTRPR